jgi:Ca-activated chloride channel family protein
LIGFDNKKEAITDASSELEGGEIGSGNSTLAVFEIVPTEQNKLTRNTSLSEDLATVSLSYSACNDSSNQKMAYKVKNNYAPLDSIDADLRFAVAVTMLGLKLKQSKYYNSNNWSLIHTIAEGAADRSNYLQNEFLLQLDKADKLYNTKKKKKKKGNDDD